MKTIFVSFDYEHDKHYKYLLEAWHKNPNFKFVFDDGTPTEINSNDVGRVKAALTTKIRNSTHTLVIVGKHSNDPHRDRYLIGYKNWINFEIAQSKANRSKIIAVKLDRSYESPEELYNSGVSWAQSFTEDSIIAALNNA